MTRLLRNFSISRRNHAHFASCTSPTGKALNDELSRHKHLTLILLWQEYKEGEPSGYQYSQFCELYRQRRKKLDRSMRQEHRAGDKFFDDYSGSTLPIMEAATGKIRGTQILVKVIGNCNLPFAEAQLQVEWADKAAALAAIPPGETPGRNRSPGSDRKNPDHGSQGENRKAQARTERNQDRPGGRAEGESGGGKTVGREESGTGKSRQAKITAAPDRKNRIER